MRARLALVAVLALAWPARAETVVTTDGRRIEGTVTERDGKIVVSPKKGIEIVLDKGEIAKIESGTSAHDDFAKKKADLAPGDVDGRYALAQWCKAKGLGQEAKGLLDEVIVLSPDHAQARRDLGYVKDGDAWVTEEALRRKLGFEKVNGKWVPAAEAKRVKRSAEIRQLLVRYSLAVPHGGAKAKAAQDELDGLAKEDPGLVAPLVEERLGEHDANVRYGLAELLGKLKAKSSAPRLVHLCLEDEDASVREVAAEALWATGDVDGRVQVVQCLFHSKRAVRDRAAAALGTVKDGETVPYLIEALYLVGTKTVAVEEEPAINRGFGGIRAEGNFGGYYVQAGEITLQTTLAYIYSKKVLSALQKITGKDFDYSKHDWFEWWEKEGKAKLTKPAPAPTPAPAPPK